MTAIGRQILLLSFPKLIVIISESVMTLHSLNLYSKYKTCFHYFEYENGCLLKYIHYIHFNFFFFLFSNPFHARIFLFVDSLLIGTENIHIKMCRVLLPNNYRSVPGDLLQRMPTIPEHSFIPSRKFFL